MINVDLRRLGMTDVKLEKKRYQRKEVAKLVGVTENTIQRREKAGKVPKPIKVVHSGDVYYTPDLVKAHLEFQEAEIRSESTQAV
jgi:transcription initiation factor TFIIIB Brf1 subunit/transcription initiation factor TFIIB